MEISDEKVPVAFIQTHKCSTHYNELNLIIKTKTTDQKLNCENVKDIDKPKADHTAEE